MEGKIRSELGKMSLVMLIMAGIGIYAHEFVVAGIQAKVALNSSIFALFGVAAAISFRNVLGLRNEVLALKALQSDTSSHREREWELCDVPAIVFHEPHLLGQGYRLIAEQMAKNGRLQLPSKVAESLVHSVDQRINERKSVILYFSGLMVFMGLIGAFMGLMHTVGSVGDLIGGMDVSGNAGNDSFGKMIEGMKAPLRGMSVGFSSSLFGLSTSMVLGALERCMTSAAKSLRDDYEHWLSSVTTLEGASPDEAAGTSETGKGVLVRAMHTASQQFANLREVVEHGKREEVRTTRALGSMYEAMADLSRMVERVSDPTPVIGPIAETVTDLARQQMRLSAEMELLFTQAREDRAHLRDAIGALHGMAASHHRDRDLVDERIVDRLDRMLACHEAALDRPQVTIHWPEGVAPTSGRMDVRALQARLADAFGSMRERARTARSYRRHAADINALVARQQRLQEELHGEIVRLRTEGSADRQRSAMLLQALEQESERLSVLAELVESDEGAGDTRAAIDRAQAHMRVLTARSQRLREAIAKSDNDTIAKAG